MFSSQKIKLLFIFFLFSIFFNFQTAFVSAYDFELHSGLGDAGYEAGYDDAGLTDEPVAQVAGSIVKQIIAYVGIFFLLLTIYAGFIWMLSRGNEQEVEKSKKILQNAIIGLIVVLLAYAITYLFMSTLTGVEGPVTEIK